jgi:hypothetical protein
MSDRSDEQTRTPTPARTTPAPATPAPRRKRSRRARLLELLFWVLVALATAWIMIQNVDTILPANNF